MYNNKYIEWGAGPRASQYLLIASKCNAAIKGKYSPDIEDVREVAVSVLRHRVLKNYKAEAMYFFCHMDIFVQPTNEK